MQDGPHISRRKLILGLGSVAIATAVVHRVVHAGGKEAAYYAPLQLPAAMPPLIRKRLLNLHARYDQIAASQGIPAMRTRILADVVAFRGYDEWLRSIAEWLHRVAWNDAGDLCVDIAEVGNESTRRNCSCFLLDRPHANLIPGGYGPRIVRLHKAETDGAALDYWRDLRKILGV